MLPFSPRPLDALDRSRTGNLRFRKSLRCPVAPRVHAPARTRTGISGVRSAVPFPVGPLVQPARQDSDLHKPRSKRGALPLDHVRMDALGRDRTDNLWLRRPARYPVSPREQMGTPRLEHGPDNPRLPMLPGTPRPRPIWLPLVGSLGSGPCSSIALVLYCMDGEDGTRTRIGHRDRVASFPIRPLRHESTADAAGWT